MSPPRLCEMCHKQQSKYKCPSCERPTCSLTCCKIHKERFSCSGERDVAKNVPLKEYSRLDYLSDYRFLDHTDTKVLKSVSENQAYKEQKARRARFTTRLAQTVAEHGARLIFLPVDMHRSRLNKTCFNVKCGLLVWSVEFRLYSGEDLLLAPSSRQPASVVLHGCEETVKLGTLYAHCQTLYHEQLNGRINTPISSSNSSSKLSLQLSQTNQPVTFPASDSALIFIAKNDSVKGQQKRYVEVFSSTRLQKALMNTTIGPKPAPTRGKGKDDKKKDQKKSNEQQLPHKLTDEQLIEYREAFDMFDKTGDQVIGVMDMGTVMRKLGLSPTNEELQNMINEIDPDGTVAYEGMNFEQFCYLASRKLDDTFTTAIITDAFRVFDRQGNGFISVSELRQVLQNMAEKLTDEEMDAMIEEANVDEDGNVRYEEFVAKMFE